MEERLQKYMARCGIASRRKSEKLIADGLVEVNGRVVREAGIRIDPGLDRVRVEGKALSVEKPAYYLHYKAKGVTTTVSDNLGRRTVMDCLPGIKERVYPVGRLDRESEGLLVLTNDGEMANFLTHPAHGVEKTYRVTAEGRVEADVLRELAEKGIRLGPALVKPTRVELVRYDNDNTIVMISVAEGINREVRRIFASLGHEVKKLLRVQVGPLTLAGLKRSGTRAMTPKEIANIRKGMDAAGHADGEALFPKGSADARRPKGPRGRARPSTPRLKQGKPDPAMNREFSKRKPAKRAAAKTAKTAAAGRARTDGPGESKARKFRRDREYPAEARGGRTLDNNMTPGGPGTRGGGVRAGAGASAFPARGFRAAKNAAGAAAKVSRAKPGAGRGKALAKPGVKLARHPLSPPPAKKGKGGRDA
ncbi:MAG: rRNA pseudouridine synthase [Planctomycetota bacterium]|jgi:23S rRNA pseudouridine2605 synthase|nr:rRNA pseudouridine synthase [Planctomycetota bacterium]